MYIVHAHKCKTNQNTQIMHTVICIATYGHTVSTHSHERVVIILGIACIESALLISLVFVL